MSVPDGGNLQSSQGLPQNQQVNWEVKDTKKNITEGTTTVKGIVTTPNGQKLTVTMTFSDAALQGKDHLEMYAAIEKIVKDIGPENLIELIGKEVSTNLGPNAKSEAKLKQIGTDERATPIKDLKNQNDTIKLYKAAKSSVKAFNNALGPQVQQLQQQPQQQQPIQQQQQQPVQQQPEQQQQQVQQQPPQQQQPEQQQQQPEQQQPEQQQQVQQQQQQVQQQQPQQQQQQQVQDQGEIPDFFADSLSDEEGVGNLELKFKVENESNQNVLNEEELMAQSRENSEEDDREGNYFTINVVKEENNANVQNTQQQQPAFTIEVTGEPEAKNPTKEEMAARLLNEFKLLTPENQNKLTNQDEANPLKKAQKRATTPKTTATTTTTTTSTKQLSKSAPIDSTNTKNIEEEKTKTTKAAQKKGIMDTLMFWKK